MFKSLSRYYFNMSMQNKLLVTYLPIVMVTILFISYISYRSTVSNMYQQSFDMNRQALLQIKTVMEKNLNYYDTFVKNIYFDRDIINYLKADYSSAFEEYSLVQRIINKWGTMLVSQKSSLNLSLIRSGDFNERINNNFDRIYENSASVDYLERTLNKSFQIYNSDKVKDRDWYKKSLVMDSGQWLQVEDDKKFNNLSYMVSFKDMASYNSKVIGLLKLTIRIEDILSISKSGTSSGIYPYMLYDNSGNNLYVHPTMKKDYVNNKNIIDGFLLQEKSKGKEQVTGQLIQIKESLPEYGLTLVSVTSLKSITLRIAKVTNLILLISLMLMVVVVALTIILSRFYVKRLRIVVGHLQRFHEGNFDEMIPYMNEDEVGYLANAFNDMSNEIRQMVDRIYKTELELKGIELSLLQHQINPHFLYNSLSTISRLVEFGEKETIKGMVHSLVSFYRLTLSNGNNVVTIKNEIEHIQSYICVFRIRMDDTMTVNYDLDKNLYSYKTIKIILQPFVENVLEHGIYRRSSPINICIRLYEKNDHIYFEIVDDGIGMTKDMLRRLKSGFTEGRSGYAIKNVDRRLKLQYGRDYELDMYSNIGIGTQVIIKIPKIY